MLRHIALFTLLIAMAHNASATIIRWGGTGGDCEIINDTVEIRAAGEYKFYSQTNGEPDLIQWIKVWYTGVDGTVTVHILHPTAGVYGASDVKEINLSNATNGNIARIYISGDLGEDGPVVANSIAGSVGVDGEILDDITIDMLGGNIVCETCAT